MPKDSRGHGSNPRGGRSKSSKSKSGTKFGTSSGWARLANEMKKGNRSSSSAPQSARDAALKNFMKGF